MLNWYILFVFTGREHHISNKINQHFHNGCLISFIPMRELFFKKSGKVHKRQITMFPGYVFIETKLCSKEFLKHLWPVTKTLSNDIIRLLRYGDSDEIAVHEDEYKSLKGLLNNNQCVEVSTGFIEGDKIYIEEGPLIGKESIIRKINKHKKVALIDLEIMGGIRQVTIGLEVLRKI